MSTFTPDMTPNSVAVKILIKPNAHSTAYTSVSFKLKIILIVPWKEVRRDFYNL